MYLGIDHQLNHISYFKKAHFSFSNINLSPLSTILHGFCIFLPSHCRLIEAKLQHDTQHGILALGLAMWVILGEDNGNTIINCYVVWLVKQPPGKGTGWNQLFFFCKLVHLDSWLCLWLSVFCWCSLYHFFFYRLLLVVWDVQNSSGYFSRTAQGQTVPQTALTSVPTPQASVGIGNNNKQQP